MLVRKRRAPSGFVHDVLYRLSQELEGHEEGPTAAIITARG